MDKKKLYTVVFADDEEDVRQAIVEELDWESLGFEIVGVAENGIEALELVEKMEPDLLVSDIKMPFKSGIELAREAREIRPNMQIVFLTGYDHFEYAKQAIRYNILEYLLKPLSHDDMDKEFRNIKSMLDKKFYDLVEVNEKSDLILENTELKKEVFLNSLVLSSNQMTAFDQGKSLNLEFMPKLLQGKNKLNLFVTTWQKEDSLTKQQILQTVKIVSDKYFAGEHFTEGNNVVSIVCDSSHDLNKYVKLLTKDIVETAKRVLEQNVKIGISNHFESLDGVRLAYSSAITALGYIHNQDDSIVYISDFEERNEEPFTSGVVIKLESILKTGTEEEVLGFLDYVFLKIKEKKISQADFSLCVLEIVSMAFRVLRTVSKEITVESPILNNFMATKSMDQVIKEVKSLCCEVLKQIKGQRQKNIDVLAEKAMALIFSNYGDKDMSLNMLSEKLHCSINYLSSLIKKSTGDTFVNILTKERMSKAKELLLLTNMKIIEISDQVGYQDQHYFSYCFKKHYGISPNKMRSEGNGEKI